jgi:hypothetical protein
VNDFTIPIVVDEPEVVPARASNPARSTLHVLLIAYHFPPSAAVGALRWEKMTHALSGRGVRVTVVTLAAEQHERSDNDPRRALPPGIRVVAVSHPDSRLLRAWNGLLGLPRRIAKAWDSWAGGASPDRQSRGARGRRGASRSLGRIVQALFRLDEELMQRAQRAWAREVWRQVRSQVSIERPDVTITSGPPHQVHFVGYQLARDFGIPHVADFRDVWALEYYHTPERLDDDQLRENEHRVRSSVHAREESKYVHGARRVVMNTEAAATAMRAAYPEHASRIVAIPNGSDPEDRRVSPPRECFTVMYAGSLYLERDPRVLFRACKPVIEEFSLSPAQFRIRLLGNVESYAGVRTLELARAAGVAEHTTVESPVARAAALDAAATAAMLVCLPDGLRYNVQAKLFEYSQLDCWVLAFVERGSAMQRVLASTSADVVLAGDSDGATARIRARWLEFAAGTRPVRIDQEGSLARERQVDRLVKELEDLSERGATR